MEDKWQKTIKKIFEKLITKQIFDKADIKIVIRQLQTRKEPSR